jgi:hypothetical protein
LITVKVTHTIYTQSGKFEAGQIVEVTDALGKSWIEQEKAFEVVDEVIPVTTMSDEVPHFIEAAKEKRGKHDNRKN